MPPMPTLVPAELSEWMVDRQADLQEAMIVGDNVRVLTVTSKLSEAAKHMCELTGSASHAVVKHGMGCGASEWVRRVILVHQVRVQQQVRWRPRDQVPQQVSDVSAHAGTSLEGTSPPD